ncbi:GntR family transcriptional regulator [Micromonospora sp. RTP1Z1]|uniref:GntR family transcriptional regulator n=1 Tax=Micromonospora sp. RTP1Z1 TaxID=2994043 RepID=UPI0039B5E12E
MIQPGQPQVSSQELAALLREQILAGELPPGARIRSDRWLQETYGISRNLVRHAIAIPLGVRARTYQPATAPAPGCDHASSAHATAPAVAQAHTNGDTPTQSRTNLIGCGNHPSATATGGQAHATPADRWTALHASNNPSAATPAPTTDATTPQRRPPADLPRLPGIGPLERCNRRTPSPLGQALRRGDAPSGDRVSDPLPATTIGAPPTMCSIYRPQVDSPELGRDEDGRDVRRILGRRQRTPAPSCTHR